MAGTLFIVGTPIGNLGDITYRAVETLRLADIIACEDTRHTGKLLRHFGISKKLLSYHEYNESERANEIVRHLTEGRSVAVVSDAGMPAISDPGYRVVFAAVAAGCRVAVVPGPSAFVAAAAVSGLPTDAIYFGGFLPGRKGERRSRLAEIRDFPATLVFYESPHRIAAAISDCISVLGDRMAAVARELTKLHEDVSRGRLSELAVQAAEGAFRGEVVLVVDRAGAEGTGSSTAATNVAERVAELEAAGHTPRSAMKTAAKEFGLSRSEAYRELHFGKK